MSGVEPPEIHQKKKKKGKKYLNPDALSLQIKKEAVQHFMPV